MPLKTCDTRSARKAAMGQDEADEGGHTCPLLHATSTSEASSKDKWNCKRAQASPGRPGSNKAIVSSSLASPYFARVRTAFSSPHPHSMVPAAPGSMHALATNGGASPSDSRRTSSAVGSRRPTRRGRRCQELQLLAAPGPIWRHRPATEAAGRGRRPKPEPGARRQCAELPREVRGGRLMSLWPHASN